MSASLTYLKHTALSFNRSCGKLSVMLFVSLILMMPRSAESYDQRHRQVNDLQGRNPPTVKRSTPEELSNNISTTASLDQRHPSVGGPHGFHYGKKGLELGCRELRSKRYISDGMCTTPRPISEVVCADWCIMPAAPPGEGTPVAVLSNYYQESDWRASRRHEGRASDGVLLEKWRCVDGASRRRRVKLLCRDGSRRVYHVRVVKSCKCTKKQDPLKGQKRQEDKVATQRIRRRGDEP